MLITWGFLFQFDNGVVIYAHNVLFYSRLHFYICSVLNLSNENQQIYSPIKIHLFNI